MSISAGRGPTLRARLFAGTSALGLAALVLAGCGQAEDEAPAQTVDPSEPVSQEDPAEAPTGNATDGEAPALEDIEEDIWDASMAQTSVSASVSGPLEQGQQLFGYSPETFEGDEDAGTSEDAGTGEDELFELSVVGQIEGDSATELNYAPDYRVLQVGDTTYQTVAGFIFDYEAQIPAEVEPEVGGAELESALLAEGEWVDVSIGELEVPRTPGELLETLRNHLDETLDGNSLADSGLEPAVETEGEQDLWVYSNDQIELTVLANAESPLLMGLTVQGEAPLEVDFDQWNEAEIPVPPEEGTVITDQLLQEILSGFVASADQG
ncbi:hypothetical protein [Nesterenkonia sp. Act20]|uniref:hypothetical protein n=1 Tax=Nesterenkonia sp. Act20 TaxID=1483432 RepID=UPI001C495A3C|nr:hypothetical protein [Nesterenkonia sp. Act20]